MLKWHIDTVFGAICIVILLLVIIISRQPCPIRDTANIAPKTTQYKPLLPSNNKNTTISCCVLLQAPMGHHYPIVIATMAVLHHHQLLLPLSWPKNQDMAPTMQGVCSTSNIVTDNIAPHIIDALGARRQWGRWWERIGIGDGDKKAQAMASKGRSLPFKQKKCTMCALTKRG
eukprot:10618958-Ditylum_brightwellii.AAC.1